jgi:hypothetical protein
MADQNRNQSNQNTSRGQQGNPGQRPSRDDEPIGTGGSPRGRSNREPTSTADDRGMGDSRRNVDNVDELESETGIESDVDVDEMDDLDEGSRSER